MSLEIVDAQTAEQLDAVRALCWEYREFLIALGPAEAKVVSVYYPKPVYEKVLSQLEEDYAPPQGATLLVTFDGKPVGCGMFHTFAPGIAEIKRVYLKEDIRGMGAGRRLMEAIIARIQAADFEMIYMDTGKPLIAARALYAKLGFRERGPYAETPPEAEDIIVYFDMDLRKT